MGYEERLANVSVIGAAGKMGSGILLLTAVELTDLSLKPENKDKTFVLNAIDISDEALQGLIGYIRAQATKLAEKKTVLLRELYSDRKDLIENFDIIDAYVADVLSKIRPTTRIEAAYNSTLVFEAANENPDLKVKLFTQIDNNNEKSPWFFTNTSSIPIGELDKKANLDGRIVGFHFYNPPAVQKLVELIAADSTKAELIEFAGTYAKNLRKKVVPSNDFAGFIGNGHFMRDALHGIKEAQSLAADMPFTEAVYTINRVSQDFLVRPMGIFQLIDYVGIDVCSYIMSVMNPYLPEEDLHSSLLDEMLELGIKGGQYSDGSQKDGFLKYEKGKPIAVFDTTKKEYVPFEQFQSEADKRIGDLPENYKPWKAVIADRNKDSFLNQYFAAIKEMDTLGAKLAAKYWQRSKDIGQLLVDANVANSAEDVNTVLLTGFFHAYGPINDYLN